MHIEAILFKDSDCGNCKLVQSEFFNNPPKCDIKICHAKHVACQIHKRFNDLGFHIWHYNKEECKSYIKNTIYPEP